MKSFNYGDIVLVKLSNGPDTNEKTVTGYAVVISADAINENLQTVIVCPLIEAKHVSDTRIGVTLIPKKAIGMDQNSLVFSLQIITISKDRIIKKISALPSNYLHQIKESLQAVLDLD